MSLRCSQAQIQGFVYKGHITVQVLVPVPEYVQSVNCHGSGIKSVNQQKLLLYGPRSVDPYGVCGPWVQSGPCFSSTRLLSSWAEVTSPMPTISS